MEAGESSARQSGITSATQPDPYGTRPREPFEKSYREGSMMATATLVSPITAFNVHSQHHAHAHAHAHSFTSAYPPSVPTTSIPSMISPVDCRRTSDELDSHPRPSLPSLPSIQEVIHGKQPAPYNAPGAGPTPTTPSLPSPFGANPPRPPFGEPSERNSSPRSLQPTSSSFPPRPEAMPTFSDPNRLQSSTRPAGPPPFPGPQVSPSVNAPEQHRQVDARPSHGYQFPPGGQPPQGLYLETGRLPPGQLPLSSYPVSPTPHQAPSTNSSSYEPQRRSIYSEEEYYNNRGNDYKQTVDRAFETWNYVDSLRMIGTAARTIFNFAEAYDETAREQHGPQPIPSRLPTERELGLMIDNCHVMRKKLEEVRDMSTQNRLSMESRTRDSNMRKGYDDDEMSMYGDGHKNYGLMEVKKRRGRAAPPGRCHSCNRIDTPEWRRGPDGARTLCNACGLHYAKLERKRQHENRSIRPKPSEDR